MNQEDFNAYCNSLWETTHVVQWRGSHVWKLGQKVFAIGRWGGSRYSGITFKVLEIAFQILRAEPGLRPAPFFASRGMKWIQNYAEPGLSDEDLKSYLSQSHQIVFSDLTKKMQMELKGAIKGKMPPAGTSIT